MNLTQLENPCEYPLNYPIAYRTIVRPIAKKPHRALVGFPAEIHGDLVIAVASSPTAVWPKGYSTPADGIDQIEPVCKFAITKSAGCDETTIFRVSCLSEDNEVVTGDFYYTLDSAKDFLETEYGLVGVSWAVL